ncbi:MAG: hypothetical protein RJB62_1995 [Pseudomonadota bacterium]|jgi:hypothetical protein
MSGPHINPVARKRVTLGGYSMPLPASRIARVLLGIGLIIGGCFAILPVLGLWMIPLGLLVLSVDFAFVRRGRRRLELWWAKRRANRVKKGPPSR